ncbi:MAG: glucose-6-phosphate 1-epimerase [Pseudomonadota bacterium]|nr:glucose-6-phosphate 1-epimerase [Pseudomonadota bacterium]
MKPSIETIEFHGTPALRLNGPRDTSAVVSLLGGQLLSWIAADGRERLFLSEKAVFDGSAPIRGGVPVCFPQFAAQGDLPKHGLLRTRRWEIAAQRSGDDYALVTLAVGDDEASRALWPHAFSADITIMLEADRLDIEFGVDNLGEAAFSFTGALHTYLRVVQVEDVAIEGLYGFSYVDKVDGSGPKKDTGTQLLIEAETDRIYQKASRPLLLQAANLSLGIQADGFPDVVIWNPWVERCAQLADMKPDDWRRMLCIEAAATQPVTVAAGESWSGRQTLVPL